MAYSKMCKAGVCTAALLTGSAALADVTAQDVWTNWQDTLTGMGNVTVETGEEAMDGDTLTVPDVVMTVADDASTVTMEMGDLTFTENGDGTVTFEMADSYPIMIEDEAGGSVTLTVSQSGASYVASGDPDAINYDISADSYSISASEMTGPDGEAMDGSFDVTLNDIAGTYATTAGDLQDMVTDLTAASVDMAVDLTDETGERFTLNGAIEDLAANVQIAMPADADFENPDNIFTDGLAVAATYSLGSGTYDFGVESTDGNVAGTAQTGATNVEVSLDNEGVLYDVSATDLAVEVEPGAAMPLPVSVSMGEYAVRFNMPLAATADPTEFGLGFTLADLVINDELYQMFDPQGVLPREPATLRIDLSGMGKLFFDVMDPEQADAMAMAEVPGELNSLDLNELTLRLAGATVDGSGALTFDNSDLESFNGMPAPEGDVTIVIGGANALIDDLVEMGLIPEDQAMMSRMMVGMFAKASGEDELTSTIEFRDGSIFANGQQVY